MSHNINNFDLHAGGDETVTITVQDSNSSAANITGAAIDFAINHRGPSGARVLTLTSSSTAQINITDSTAGIFQVTFASSATLTFSGRYQYQSKTSIAGSESYVISGLVEFWPSNFSSAE